MNKFEEPKFNLIKLNSQDTITTSNPSVQTEVPGSGPSDGDEDPFM